MTRAIDEFILPSCLCCADIPNVSDALRCSARSLNVEITYSKNKDKTELPKCTQMHSINHSYN